MVPSLLQADVTKLKKDMYEGNGPNDLSITTRMALVEEKVDKIDKTLSKLFWTCFSTLVVVLGDVLFKGVTGK